MPYILLPRLVFINTAFLPPRWPFVPSSEWFLDPITPDPLVRYLPSIYRAILSPARALYHLMGPDKARAFGEKYGVTGKSQDEYTVSHFVSTVLAAVQFWLVAPDKAGAGAHDQL